MPPHRRWDRPEPPFHHHIITTLHHHISASSHRHIIPSLHHHIITSSHHYITTPLHHHISTSSHHHISTSSHHHIIASSHHHITTYFHHPIIPSSHHHIITSSHNHIITSSHHHTITPSHHHTIASSPAASCRFIRWGFVLESAVFLTLLLVFWRWSKNPRKIQKEARESFCIRTTLVNVRPQRSMGSIVCNVAHDCPWWTPIRQRWYVEIGCSQSHSRMTDAIASQKRRILVRHWWHLSFCGASWSLVWIWALDHWRIRSPPSIQDDSVSHHEQTFLRTTLLQAFGKCSWSELIHWSCGVSESRDYVGEGTFDSDLIAIDVRHEENIVLKQWFLTFLTRGLILTEAVLGFRANETVFFTIINSEEYSSVNRTLAKGFGG